jgi:hypothetical protein
LVDNQATNVWWAYEAIKRQLFEWQLRRTLSQWLLLYYSISYPKPRLVIQSRQQHRHSWLCRSRICLCAIQLLWESLIPFSTFTRHASSWYKINENRALWTLHSLTSNGIAFMPNSLSRSPTDFTIPRMSWQKCLVILQFDIIIYIITHQHANRSSSAIIIHVLTSSVFMVLG